MDEGDVFNLGGRCPERGVVATNLKITVAVDYVVLGTVQGVAVGKTVGSSR